MGFAKSVSSILTLFQQSYKARLPIDLIHFYPKKGANEH